jgi:hypothetical protein
MAKTKRQLADEAWQRTMAQLPSDTLGQRDLLTGECIGALKAPPMTELPAACPACAYTGGVQHLPFHQQTEPGHVMCGWCGARFDVGVKAWEALKAEVRRRFAEPPKVAVKRERRTRGAG